MISKVTDIFKLLQEASISHFEFIIISRQRCLSSTQNLSKNIGAYQWLAKMAVTKIRLRGELIVQLS